VIDRLVDFASLDGTGYRYMQYLAVVAILAVWLLDATTGVIAPWDWVAYPLLAVVLAVGAWVATMHPRRTPWVRLTTVAALNAFMVLEVHMILWSQSPLDMYQLNTTLQWYPLAYGLSYLFLNNRAAIVLTGLVVGYELVSFSLRTVWFADTLQAPGYLVPLLWNTLISQVMYAALLIAIIHIKHQMRTMQAQAQALTREAQSDALTGVLNRRGLDELLSQRGTESARGQVTSVFMIDVDHFKAINDSHGHRVGDTVLVDLARLIGTQIREADTLGRWGGEEFLLVAPGIAGPRATELGERIRQAVAQHPFAQVGRLTISVGVATWQPQNPHGARMDNAIERADQALYTAKNSGRNRVVTAPD
jgi:diguanylate cyclase (GGDEF)-like protein